MKKNIIISIGVASALIMTSTVSMTSFAETDAKKQENSQTRQDNMPEPHMGRGPMNGPGHMMGRGYGMGPREGMGPGGMMMGNTGMMPMMGRGGMMGMMGHGGMMRHHHGMGAGKWFIEREYTSEDAQRIVDGLLARRGFAKLKVSKVEKAEEGYLKVEVSTVKGEAVFNLKFDTRSGMTSIIQ